MNLTSKGLEALDNLRCMTSLSQDCPYKESNDLCDIIEKELRALEIINRKHVNVTFLKQTFLWSILDEKGLREYNCNFGYDDDGYHSNELTEKEYKLLKEVLL